MNDHDIQLKHYAIGEIELAPNPRPSDKIKPEAIDEMAESILEHGIIQPPSARLMPDGKPQLYIGQRRFFGLTRALQLAEERSLDAALLEKLRLMPLLVRVIDDRAMLEQQWIENLQREDVTARDEAQGFDFMQRTLGYTLDEIGHKIGKTKGYVSNRLKLMGAPEVLWKAFEEGRVGTRHLELVGSIPHPKDREEAARAIIKPQFQDKPLTVLEATEMVGSRYVVSLRACGFDKEDPALVKMEWKDGARCLGGACVDCPFLSKNDLELAGSLGGGVGNSSGGLIKGGTRGVDPNLCMNPTCFKAKQDAAWQAVKNQAAQNGKRCMDVDQTAPLFHEYGAYDLKETSGLINLAGEPGYQETGHFGEEVPAWEDLLKGTSAKKEAIMARHPKTNKVLFLLERERAIELAEENDPANKKLFAARPQGKGKKKVTVTVIETEEGEGTEADTVPVEDEAVTTDASTIAAASADSDAQGRSVSQVINEAQLEQMEVFTRALLDGELSADALVRVLMQSRLARLTLPAKHLMCAALVDEDHEVILGWHHDACTRVIIGSDEDAVDLLLVAELAQSLVLGDKLVTAQMAKMMKVAVDLTDKPAEQLYTCETCGTPNFTRAGLKSHNCAKRVAAAKAAEPAADDWAAQWEALPPKPSKESPDFKPWDALRKKIKYHAEKAGITLKAKTK